MSFEQWCERGEAADQLLARREFAGAEAAYLELLDAILASKRLDAFVVGKIALGLMLALVGQDREAEAHRIWTQTIEDGGLGIGIYALENGQVSVHDLIVYCLVASHLHTLGTDRTAAYEAVTDYMKRTSAYALAEDRSLLPLVANSWRRYHDEIREGDEVPASYAAPLERFLSELPPQAPRPLAFPPPSAWRVDWNGEDDVVTSFHPDGSVRQQSRADVGSKKKRGFFRRLLGR